ncbi:MAG: CopG family transcriptional regulator [bacterium]
MPKRVPSDATSKVTIKIPRALYNRLREIIAGSGFDSVTDFVVYVLRDLAASSGSGGKSMGKRPRDQGTETLTAEEVQAVRQRLKSLGYL